jgi:four helix bundle protein
MAKYIELKDLKVYQLARKLSELAWPLYTRLDFDSKKTIGNQFIRAVDSIGANIAEGYNRYHHLDRVKFLLLLKRLSFRSYISLGRTHA